MTVYNIFTEEKRSVNQIKNYVITYTLDFCNTVKTMTVKALDYTKAYLAAVVELLDDVAILEAKETECAFTT